RALRPARRARARLRQRVASPSRDPPAAPPARLALSRGRGLRQHLLEPADDGFPLAQRLLPLGERRLALRLGERLLAGTQLIGVDPQLFEPPAAVGDLRLCGAQPLALVDQAAFALGEEPGTVFELRRDPGCARLLFG